MTEIRFTVVGVPRTKGSLVAFVNKKTGKAVVTEPRSSHQRTWAGMITDAAQAAMTAAGITEPLDGPLEFWASWTLPKPRTSKHEYPALKNRDDGDKHQRSVWDALTDIVWRDDGLVVDWHGKERYVGQPDASLPHPGVVVLVRTLG